MKLDILHIACIVAIFQALLMAVAFLTSKKGNKQSNKILAFWFLSFAVVMSSSFFVSIGVWQYFVNYHKLIFVVSQLSLLIGPLFYFYTLSLLDENFLFRKKDLIHLLPFVAIILYLTVRFIFIRNFIIWQNFLDFFKYFI